MNEQEVAVLKAYLCDGWSQRQIQEAILGIEAPIRGGGYETMRTLRKFGVTGEYKACLKGRKFNAKAFEAAGNIKNHLRTE